MEDNTKAALQQILLGVRHNRAPCSRWVLEPEDVILLERVFALEKCPGRELRQQLAEHLNVTSRQVQVWFQNKRQRTKNGAKPTAAEVLARSQSAALQTPPGGAGASIQDAGEVLLSFAGGRKEGESNGSPTSLNLGKRSLGMQSRRPEPNNAGQQMPVQFGMMPAMMPGMNPWAGAMAAPGSMGAAPMFFPAPMGRMYAPMNGMMQTPPFVGSSAPHALSTGIVAPAGSALSSGGPAGTASDTSSEGTAGAGQEDSAKRAKLDGGEQLADAPGGAPPSGLNLPDAYTDGQRVWLRQDLIMSTTQVMQAPSGAASAPQMQMQQQQPQPQPQQMLALPAPAPASAQQMIAPPRAPVPMTNSTSEAVMDGRDGGADDGFGSLQDLHQAQQQPSTVASDTASENSLPDDDTRTSLPGSDPAVSDTTLEVVSVTEAPTYP